VTPSDETEATYQQAVGSRDPSGEPVPVAAPEPSRFSGYSVLVVEDHDFQRRTVLQLLRRLGVTALSEANEGQAALDLLSDGDPPDVMV
jgi:PleD family two-component response regulator